MKLNAKQLANQVDVPYTTLLSWVNNGLIHPVKRPKRARTPIEFDRKGLREAKIMTKLRRKAASQTLRKVAQALDEWGHHPFSIGDFLVIEEKGEESVVSIYENEKQLEISTLGDITMILPLYPIEKEIDGTSPYPPPSIVTADEKEILRSFKGRVERIDKETAYMTLIDDDSRQSMASCSLKELRVNGMTEPYEGMMFTCNIERKSGETSIYFKPIARRKLTEDEIHLIDAELERDFPDTEHDY